MHFEQINELFWGDLFSFFRKFRRTLNSPYSFSHRLSGISTADTIYTKLQVIWTRTVTYKIFFKFRFLVSPGSIFGSYMQDGQQVSKFRFSPTQKWNIILPLFICNVVFWLDQICDYLKLSKILKLQDSQTYIIVWHVLSMYYQTKGM